MYVNHANKIDENLIERYENDSVCKTVSFDEVKSYISETDDKFLSNSIELTQKCQN